MHHAAYYHTLYFYRSWLLVNPASSLLPLIKFPIDNTRLDKELVKNVVDY